MKPLDSILKAVRDWFQPPPAAAPERLQAVNLTRGTVLATRLESAHTAATRKKGLLGRDSFLPGEGLWIAPCESVHTFFMHFPIDLVYLDQKKRIRKVRSSVGPWRMSACFTAKSVIELPAGTIGATRTERGDVVEMRPVAAESASA